VTANNASRPYGTPNPAFTGSVNGIQNGDNITATYASTASVSSPPGTYLIVPALTDPGNKLPNYAVTLNSGTLTVTAPTAPTISSIVRSPTSTDVTLTWNSTSNVVYRVQYKTNLASAGWFDLAPDVTATGSTASFTDHPGAAPQRFYRVLVASLVPAQPPAILGIKGNSAGTVTVTLAGTPGARYVVQAATTLTRPITWANLATNTAGTDGRWTLTDSTTNSPLRFYRGVFLP
jgi:hypothetical protein